MLLVELDLLRRENEHAIGSRLRLRCTIRSISQRRLQMKIFLLEEPSLPFYVGCGTTVIGAMLGCCGPRQQHFADCGRVVVEIERRGSCPDHAASRVMLRCQIVARVPLLCNNLIDLLHFLNLYMILSW